MFLVGCKNPNRFPSGVNCSLFPHNVASMLEDNPALTNVAMTFHFPPPPLSAICARQILSYSLVCHIDEQQAAQGLSCLINNVLLATSQQTKSWTLSRLQDLQDRLEGCPQPTLAWTWGPVSCIALNQDNFNSYPCILFKSTLAIL